MPVARSSQSVGQSTCLTESPNRRPIPDQPQDMKKSGAIQLDLTPEDIAGEDTGEDSHEYRGAGPTITCDDYFARRKTSVDVQSSVLEAGDDGPFIVPERPPLHQLRTVHIAYPAQYLLVLSLLMPPAFDTLHLTLQALAANARAVVPSGHPDRAALDTFGDNTAHGIFPYRLGRDGSRKALDSLRMIEAVNGAVSCHSYGVVQPSNFQILQLQDTEPGRLLA
ncbi:hypothetical protein B0H13DRAFT_2313150 [Mycena leptocephala]|nr:hypothetical protein B0H13DRAFT_2313150 [Mycena leptocephala]